MEFEKPYQQADLQRTAQYARRVLKDEKLRHVVYAYIKKDEPDATHILDWGLVKFKTDAEFDAYLNEVGKEVEMFYAVHSLSD